MKIAHDAASAMLMALLPHLSDLPSRLSELMPRILRAAAQNNREVQALQMQAQAQQLALWQQDDTLGIPVGVAGNDWRQLPYFRLARRQHDFLRRWSMALVDVLKLDAQDEARLRFILLQWIDAVDPDNFAVTNPEVIERALRTQGKSLLQGEQNLRRDLARGRLRMSDESAFEVGRNVAMTPGAVVFQNDLIQLIQYAPRTPNVYRTPILMVPPFINKYYILDLGERNSFVRHALDQGFQVFMISWCNTPAVLAPLRWDDYALVGVQIAIHKTLEVTRAKKLHALGFCVGGTLLTSALSSCTGTDSVASLTLLASLLDFGQAGDIRVFIDEHFVARTESLYAQGGVVPGAQLSSAFASLRARDLVWKFVIENYLLGDTPAPFDLLYWNSDSANLPGRLFAWYLRNCYLENKLRIPHATSVGGTTVDMSRVRVPTYVLGTELDHIVPWQSAFASAQLMGDDVQFVLGGSGHIAGVVSPPGAKRRGYRIGTLPQGDANSWFASSKAQDGSWWPHWYAWLAQQEAQKKPAPKTLGARATPPAEAAPGSYVRETSTTKK